MVIALPIGLYQIALPRFPPDGCYGFDRSALGYGKVRFTSLQPKYAEVPVNAQHRQSSRDLYSILNHNTSEPTNLGRIALLSGRPLASALTTDYQCSQPLNNVHNRLPLHVPGNFRGYFDTEYQCHFFSDRDKDMKEDAKRFRELLHAERMYHQRHGKNTVYRWNNKYGTIYDWRRWMRRRRSYSGEKYEGLTNERGDDKLRMGRIRLGLLAERRSNHSDSVTQSEREKLTYDKEHRFEELTIAI